MMTLALFLTSLGILGFVLAGLLWASRIADALNYQDLPN